MVPGSLTHDQDLYVARAQAWTAYWQSGVLHSLPGTFEGNYAGQIGLQWRTFFANLQGPCRVLDLATGNGPLPACLLEVNQRQDVTCTAVDLALVEPEWWLNLSAPERERVQFIGGVDLGRLPFAERQFDAVISQFGFEYGPQPDARSELVRVLRTDGHVQLVCHHRDSFLLAQARHEQSHLDWLLAPEGWLQAARDMLEPMALAGHTQGQQALTSNIRYQRIRERFDFWAQAAEHRVQTLPGADVLGEVGQSIALCFQQALSQGYSAGLTQWDELHGQLQLACQRLHHMVVSAFGPSDIKALIHGLEQDRIQLMVARLEDEHGLWAWSLSGKKMGA